MKHNALPRIVLEWTLPALRALPYPIAIRVVGVLGEAAHIAAPLHIASYQRAVRDAALRYGCAWESRRLGSALAVQAYRRRARDLLIERLKDDQLNSIFSVEGREQLDSSLARGRGVLLLINHLGSHLCLVHWMFRNGYPVRCFGERPRRISRFVQSRFDTGGSLGQLGLFVPRNGRSSDAAPMILQATRILQAGMVLTAACDIRWRDARAVPARFLGAVDHFSTTWVNLAALSGAAVVPAYCRLQPSGAFQVEFHRPFHVPRTALHDGSARHWTQRALDHLESQIRRYPEHCDDYFFWDADRRRARDSA
jgi:KDO2-lipid IV(A) lauroyltransferase